jgi:transposase
MFLYMKTETKPNITEEELAVLRKLVDSGKLPSKTAIRLLVILNRAEGKTLESISDFLPVSLSSVSRYIKRFNAGGLESLLKDKTRKPGKAPVSVETKNKLCAIARNEKPKDAAHWSVRSLAKRVGISKSAAANILRERGIKPRPVETFQFSSDERFEEKLEDVVGLYMNPPDNAIILCVDEKSQIQALERTQPLLPLPENIPARRGPDSERHGTTTLLAALNVLTGEAAGECKDRHRTEDYIEFLKTVDKKCGAGKVLHIIADNYSTHKTKEVKEYIESVPGRFEAHFIPGHSSWLNMAARWFGETTNKRMRRESWNSVKELVNAIKEYIESWNKESKPFRWTKSAGEIMGGIKKAKAAYSN